MREPRRVDLWWGWSGDLVIGPDGDLKDTSEHDLVSFMQEAQTRLRGELYDWALHPHIGASLTDLVGETNSRETAEDGKTRIIAALTKDSFVDTLRIKVRYVPVGLHKILYSVVLSVPNIGADEIVNLSLLWDAEASTILFL